MTAVCLKTTLHAPAADVWEIVRDFGGLGKFLAPVKSCTVRGEGIGAIRTLILQDGARIDETLEKLDDAARVLVHSIASSPLPLDQYVATMTVRELGPDACEVEWASTFHPAGAPEAKAREIVEGVYTAGFAGLKKLFKA